MKLIFDFTATELIGYAAVAGLEGEDLEKFKQEVEKNEEYNFLEVKEIDEDTYKQLRQGIALVSVALIGRKIGLK